MKLPQRKFRFDIKKRFLLETVVSYYNRLPREEVGHGTHNIRAQGASGQCPESQDLFLGSPVMSWELG